MQVATNKQVYLRGDRGLQYGDLMEVMSRLIEAGVLNVGLETQLPTAPR
jgi:biopolymer transport protein ExbD